MPTFVAPSLRLSSRLIPQARRLALGVVCLGLTNYLGVAIPQLLRRAIDTLRGGQGDVLGRVSHLAAAIAALALLQAVIRTGSRILIFNAGRNIEFGLRQELFGCLTRRPPGFFQTTTVGDIMSRLTNDLSAVRLLFGPGLLNLINTPIIYAAGLWRMTSISVPLSVVALVPFPLIVLLGRLTSRSLFRGSRELQEQLGILSTALQEDISGMATVRTYSLEADRRRRFARLNDEYLRKTVALVRARGVLTPLFAMTAGLGTLIVLWMGGKEVLAGTITLGQLVEFNTYLAIMAWPTMALGWVLSIWQRGTAGWVRVRELLATDQVDDDASGSRADLPFDLGADPLIRVQDLTVVRTQRGEKSPRVVLAQISFQVRKGQTVAIVGPTGCGKTTLLDALQHFFAVPPGTIEVGGRELHQIARPRLRTQIGYAPQEAFLFSATIAENIAFGRRDLADPPYPPDLLAGIHGAAEVAGLTRDLAELPDGLQTVVGERGIALSGGQRQRVALARAVFADPPILILDDSLSAVDAETEQRILERLRPVLGARTTLIVSHRVAAVRHADLILVLQEGRLVERGSHDDLLAAGGLYAALYQEQVDERPPAERSPVGHLPGAGTFPLGLTREGPR